MNDLTRLWLKITKNFLLFLVSFVFKFVVVVVAANLIIYKQQQQQRSHLRLDSLEATFKENKHFACSVDLRKQIIIMISQRRLHDPT